MQRFNLARCPVCGKTPASHAVEQRLESNPVPVGHAFVFTPTSFDKPQAD